MDFMVKSVFKNGFWIWDDIKESLCFISRELSPTQGAPATSAAASAGTGVMQTIKFKDGVDKLEKLTFRRLYQRRCRPTEPEVITVQDIKDVALYLATPADIFLELIPFIHLPIVDRLYRALIVYFQYYIQIWDYMIDRRTEASRKLRQPIVTELEDIVRDNLSDLRAMVAREYGIVISGVGKAKQFHHMKDLSNSLADKDRHIYEQFLCITVRVIWVALQRKHLNLIELELHRMLRTPAFNVITHNTKILRENLARTIEEDRVLIGCNNPEERTLKQRSATIKELRGDHDFRMLGIGLHQYAPTCARIDYLEAAFAAPEEQLIAKGVGVGLLGIPRSEYDAMLQGRERTSKNFDKPFTDIPLFKIPPKVRVSDSELPLKYPDARCTYRETNQTKRSRRVQTKKWLKYIEEPLPDNASNVQSSDM